MTNLHLQFLLNLPDGLLGNNGTPPEPVGLVGVNNVVY